jgi:hypothetical protein
MRAQPETCRLRLAIERANVSLPTSKPASISSALMLASSGCGHWQPAKAARRMADPSPRSFWPRLLATTLIDTHPLGLIGPAFPCAADIVGHHHTGAPTMPRPASNGIAIYRINPSSRWAVGPYPCRCRRSQQRSPQRELRPKR